MALELNINLKGLSVVLNLLNEARLPVLVPCMIKLHRFMWGGLCWQEFGTIQPLATRHKQPLSLSAAVAVIEASSDLTGNYFVFVNDYHSNLATDVLAERGFPHSPLSMRGNDYFGTMPHLYKDTRVVAPSEPHTQTQFINRCGRKYFFLSLLRGMLRLECVG